ncbi:MAG: DNA-3-methyladenine glycosylase [Eubacteriales bacterium]
MTRRRYSTADRRFRFERAPDNSWSGVAHGRRITVSSRKNTAIITGVTEKDFGELWQRYFDLSRDYDGIADILSSDRILSEAIALHPGIRILRQDPWETLVSFIISACNNIPRIKKIIASLCELCALPAIGGGFAFPSPEHIVHLGEDGLAPIRAGFRAKYILSAAKRIANGEVSLAEIGEMDTPDALTALCSFDGVGVKVASCVLLFGYGRAEVFPVDVWIKRVMEKHYPERDWRELFGEYAGIAQQYLYVYEKDAAKRFACPTDDKKAI